MSTMQNGKIKVLDAAAISKIAAGEVIERPASVIKELVENSLDSGATQINISIKNGGCSLIEVTDNGSGIGYDDLPLALVNHATSKLDPADLDHTPFLGFRGEALASIRAIAKLRIVSLVPPSSTLSLLDKPPKSGRTSPVNSKPLPEERRAAGWEISAEGENISHPCPAYRSEPGTSITVQDLFCLTPNRLRFLPSKQSENATITSLVQQLALSNLAAGFKLKIDHRIALDLPPSQDISARIISIMGRSFWEDAVKIDHTGSYLRVHGYTLIPTACTSRGKTIVFANGRIIRESKIQALIKAAYAGLIDKSLSPSAVVFIECDPRSIDANVHPHKTQVRFSDEAAMKNDLLRAFSLSLQRSGISFNNIEEMIERRLLHNLPATSLAATAAVPAALGLLTPLAPPSSITYPTNPAYPSSLEDSSAFYDHNGPSYRASSLSHSAPFTLSTATTDTASSSSPPAFPTTSRRLGQPLYQLDRLYIVAIDREEDALVIVDQHAAHERLTLERMKKAMAEEGSLPRQLLLFPEIIDLPTDDLHQLTELQTTLARFGFNLTITTDNSPSSPSIAVRSVPAIFGGISCAKALMIDLFNRILAAPSLAGEISAASINLICGEIACHSSIRAGRTLSLQEMDALLRAMEEENFSAQCNHGRPTYVKLHPKLLGKLFDR